MRIFTHELLYETHLKEDEFIQYFFFGENYLDESFLFEENIAGEDTFEGSFWSSTLGFHIGGPLGAILGGGNGGIAGAIGGSASGAFLYSLFKKKRRDHIIKKVRQNLGDKEAKKVKRAYTILTNEIAHIKNVTPEGKEQALKLRNIITSAMERSKL